MQIEVSSTQQLDMFVDAAQEQHLCLDCGVDISHRSLKALRCKPCSTNHEKIRNRQSANDYYRANRTKVMQRVKSYQQTPEAKLLRQEWEERNPEKLLEYRQRQKQKHREKTGYNPEGRTCEDCHAGISHRGHNAKRCVPCSIPPARTCIVCDNDIGKRGSSRFCSEECKVQDHLLKESMRWTMVCTKCKETKQYIEFRMHYNRRDSTCKSCEATATREYYQSLPVNERQKRRRIQGDRERIKKANLSPAEKAIQKTKARDALMRRRFGDFDEFAEYLKQEGKCAICRCAKPFKKDATASECLELDHDHLTGRPRGFLCKNCNFKLLSSYERFPPQYQDSPYLNAYLSQGDRQ